MWRKLGCAAALAAALCGIGATAAKAAIADAVEAYREGNYAAALAACKAEAEQGNSSCQNFLGVLYRLGKGVKQSDGEAVQWFRRAAEQGHGYAAYNLGQCYAEGAGIARSDAEAIRWYQRAAEQHIAPAEVALGVMALRQHDEKTALKWFRQGAHDGSSLGEFAVGAAYDTGRGIRRNEKLAAKWFQQSAEHGNAEGQVAVARVLERGIGFERDFGEAYFWYSVALRNPRALDASRREAQEGVKRVGGKLSPAARVEAEKSAASFQPSDVRITRGGSRSRIASDHVGRGSGESGGGGTGGAPRLYATGSGFFVSTAGHAVTNNHVVDGCAEVRVTEGDKSTQVKMLATDGALDLALLQLPHSVPAAAAFREDAPKLGESVVVMGFPLAGLVSSDAIVTTGIVSALAGLRNDKTRLQISAPVQPGNSGGPLLDGNGRLIGVIVSKLDGVRVAELTGAIPENVNFAIKGEEAKAFLKANSAGFATGKPGPELGTAAIADQALKYTVRIECWK